jgi:hypothetical protein
MPAVLSVSAMTCPDSFPFPSKRFESFQTAARDLPARCGQAERAQNNWQKQLAKTTGR